MITAIVLGCIALGCLIYFAIVRPLLIPIEWRIPTGKAYRATLIHRSAKP
jgi:hypothetical protein